MVKVFGKFIILALIPLFLAVVNVSAETGVILLNPSFEEGEANIANGWSTWQWDKGKDITVFKLEEGDAKSGNRFMTIINNRKNDARLTQTVRVDENSKYRISCWIRAENIGSDGKGANISVEGYLETSRDIRDSNGRWEQTVLYIQTAKGVNSFVLTLGLGGYGSINTGTASFDDIAIEKVQSIPAGSAVAFIEPVEAAGKKDEAVATGNSHGRPFWLMIAAAAAATAAYIHYRKRFKKATVSTVTHTGYKPAVDTRFNRDSIRDTDSIREKPKLSRADYIIMSAMTVIYLAVALVNLGSMSAPETGWNPASSQARFTIDFTGKKDISRITYFCARGTGWSAEGSYNLEFRDEDGQYKPLITLNKDDVFKWKYENVSVTTDSIRIIVNSPGGQLNEICFFENGNEKPVPVSKPYDVVTGAEGTGAPENLFDEQHKFVFTPSYLNSTYFDEIYHARTAYEHIHGIEPYENTHPPLGKLFISLGILIFGMNPFGWRIIGTLFGAAMIPIMYLFGWKLFRKRFHAFCTAFLMMFDFMHFTQSRIATIDVYVTFFIILMFYFMYDYFMNKSYETGFKKSLKPLFFSGFCFSLGVASKWIALYGAAGLAFLFFLAKYWEYKDYKEILKKVRLAKKTPWVKDFIPIYIWRTFAACIVFFILFPVLIYILSYIPFMYVDGPGHGIKDVLSLQKHMYDYHSGLKQGHAFSSPWWQWPVMTRPVWFYSGSGLPPGKASTIASFGNPAIWWTGIPAFFAAAVISVIKRDRRMTIVFTAIASQYLPWILVPRITFIYHYFSIVPFIILCIVYVVDYLIEEDQEARYFVYAYLALVFVFFVVFYPVISGMETGMTYINRLRWFGTWIF